MSLALHNYHDTYFSFPANGSPVYSDKTSPANRYSVLFCILPFIEQQPIYDAYCSDAKKYQATLAAGTSMGPWTTNGSYPALAQLRSAQIDGFQCPSDSNARMLQDGNAGRTSYCASQGDWADYSGLTNNVRGAFPTGPVWNGMNALSDGTSNTAVFSEKAVGGELRLIRGGIAYVAGASLANGSAPTSAAGCSVSDCRYAQQGNEYSSSITDAHLGGWTRVGSLWADGVTVRMGFTTILPPNSASCASGSDPGNLVREHDRAITSATSYHPGGVQVGLGDGSVRFVNDTIDSQTASGVNYCVDNGESPFGVWGALGSINGGESKSL